VVVAEESLPPADGAYHGDGLHVFLDGQVTLVCADHGGFTISVDPPRRPGATAIADYAATFVGELSLSPPLVPSTTVFPIVVQAHMVERITLAQRRGTTRSLDTEMVTLDLRGAGMPENVMVRESPTLGSLGRATITSLPRGLYRVESFYDVWLEISLDAGRSWHPAETAVRMSIAPAGGPPTPASD
jgi:hypothetical protein